MSSGKRFSPSQKSYRAKEEAEIDHYWGEVKGGLQLINN